MTEKIKAVLFDLDGVIVDTAKYHYKAWKQMSSKRNIYFDEKINERLKGVSRIESLEIILEKSQVKYSESEKIAMAEEKNTCYVEMLSQLNNDDILPGIENFLNKLKKNDIKTAICSASKNTNTIMDRIGVRSFFDTIVSGNDTGKSKPDPEVFLIASQRLGVKPCECLVVEDSAAGIQAANAGGMMSIGIGDDTLLKDATKVVEYTGMLSEAFFK